jgi:hypothetical protein
VLKRLAAANLVLALAALIVVLLLTAACRGAAQHTVAWAAQNSRPDQNSIALDVNGRQIVLRGAVAREWQGTVIELNDWWSFTIPRPVRGNSVCVNADAFTVKQSVRGGRDYDGIYFDPSTMQVGSARVLAADGRLVSVRSVTRGFIKPLTATEAALCLGRR